MSLILDGSLGTTFNDGSNQPAAASPYVLKNRIINGDFRIDQRNAGTSTTPTTNGTYNLDRWRASLSQSSKFSVQQSSTAPAGFTKSIICTSLSAYTVGASENFNIQQCIEGFNIADLGWGAVGAATVTLSFWVRSSLTGTFGGSLRNNDYNRSYPFSYTISAANTWEQKTVTIAGDTTGTWNSDSNGGLWATFSLGTGSTLSGTSSSWAATNYASATGATSVVGTNGATLYLTGVQLEIGTSATPFERRMYTNEFQLCQRYFQTISNGPTGSGSTTQFTFGTLFPVVMRVAPSGAVTAAMRISDITTASFTQSSGSIITNLVTPEGGSFHLPNFTGMTANRPALVARDGTGVIQLSAEL
jgi:hypothetical protein